MATIGTVDTLVQTSYDGRTIVKSQKTIVVAAGMIHLSVTLGYIRTIDAVLDVKMIATDPKTTAYGEQMITVSGNVVGFTLFNVAAGTTLTAEVVAIGY